MYPFIKYEIQRHVINDPNSDLFFVGAFDTKCVSKKQFIELKKEGWFFVRKRYLLVTPFFDWWMNSLTMPNKIAIIMPILIFILGYIGYRTSTTTDSTTSKVGEPLIEQQYEPTNQANEQHSLTQDTLNSLEPKPLSIDSILNEKSR
jgi:hypothetical protein